MCRLALLLLVLCFALTACRSSDDGSTTVNGMTFAEVQQRVIDALLPEDAVLHTRETFDEPSNGPPLDIWRSVASDEARMEGALYETPLIYADGIRYAVSSEGAVAADPQQEPLPLVDLLGSAYVIAREQDVNMQAVTLNGEPVIRLAIPNRCIHGPCDGTHALYISASTFLPIQLGDDPTVWFDHERIPRSALSDDFFSRDVIAAIAASLPSPAEVWKSMGYVPYWLGASFDGLVPQAEEPFKKGGVSGYFDVRYYPPGADPTMVLACIFVSHRSDLVSPPLHDPVETLSTVEAPVGKVTIYRSIEAWAAWHGLVDGGTLMVVVYCDPPGVTLRSVEGMTRIASALSVYDGPALMSEFVALSDQAP